MKILPNNNLNEQASRHYNKRLRSIRSLVERVIGVLKTRFRCLIGERQLRYHQTKVSYVVYACATLHNFLILNRFDIMRGMKQNDLRNDDLIEHIRDVENVDNQRAGIIRRSELVEYFWRQLNAQ